jgi:hypothetical protein
MHAKSVVLLLLAGVCLLAAPPAREPVVDARLKHSLRKAEQNGWTYVHLEGSPSEIGFQHGYHLAPEILDLQKVLALELKHDTGKDYDFYRTAAEKMLWPHIETEYREEMQGIVQGLAAKNVKLDIWDVVVMNASIELGGYYNDWYNKKNKIQGKSASAPEHCSAFVATGSYTRDGKIVIAHNNWSGYMDGERWSIIFDIAPAKGSRIIMDGEPGWIHSGDDFGVNSAGIVITETTISRFQGFDPDGIPEFVRARKAMQYSASIDDFARIMKEGNNGGYANNWLVADRKTNEIADLELGLKNVTLRRTKDGYFVGSNFPIDPKMIREETEFDVNDKGYSANARKVRAEQLVEGTKGKIDIAFAKKYLSDHYDSFEGKIDPNERTLCGHIELSPRGIIPWEPAWGAAGAVQNKATDGNLAAKMEFQAALGHSCGMDFKAAGHLQKHPEFEWQKEYLHDMPARQWTLFEATKPLSY